MIKKNLVKSAGIIICIAIISKILGFLRDATIASSFGASLSTDAYIMSLIIPNILFEVIGTAISITFIPILSESYRNNGKDDMFNFSNSIINLLFLICIFLCIFGWIFTPDIVRIIAPKFSGEKYILTIKLTHISIINILFMSITAGYTAILQTLNDFTAPALMGIALSVPIIIYNFLGARFGIYGLVIVTLIGYGLQVIIQIPWIIKNKYKYSLKINFHDSRIKKMLGLIMPILIGVGVDQINSLVDRIMASGLPDGSIASLDFATKVNSLVYSIFAMAIVTVIYPTLSTEGSENNYSNFRRYISKAINNINMLMIPSTIGLVILRFNVIRILFKHGAFNENAVIMTSKALLFLSIGMIFYGIRDVCNRAFYALKDTKTPMINGIFGVCACISMNLVMVPRMGLAGLALANTTSAIVCALFLIKNLRKKINGINGNEILDNGIKIFISSIIMGAGVYGIERFMSQFLYGFRGEIILLICSILVGVTIYFIMLMILGVKEFKFIMKISKNKLKALIQH
ncbi:murein biosynthesis integral membrane protein MurJ [Clostridium scatologenes]|uniref:Probable lipid II flippase MurJ n=1 Tax=Clostridium scatologenes TaxID=1548 RepID=A0A0E3M6W5_CLOSL|nr:murein biosynthesis integral membrane protein MurJ [Clostridium scatologenes]AKA67163.1 hypothetical protein CSCA_0038 [Clostridium scatologenes]